jgi:crossover junction endodeoxyribonuclease RuvC
MRYLGIDPGTTRIGYGIVEDSGGSLRPLAWGIVGGDGKGSLHDKASTAKELAKLIAEHKPVAAGVERLFFMNNAKTAMAVAEMRGVIMLTLAQCDVRVVEFTPQQVKRGVCGHGGAKKKQMQDMVQMLLRIKERITPDDAADALALALCCSTSPQPR